MPDFQATPAPRSGEFCVGQATALEVSAGQHVRIVNHLGQQVVDTWMFVAADYFEYLSMEHCRGQLYKLFYEVGDVLISNRRRPMVRICEDTSPGMHDTLCSACDVESYAEQGQGENHPNCSDNLRRCLSARGVTAPFVPCPWNLFMEIPVQVDGRMSDRPSNTAAGEGIELEALTDLVLVCSPCPQEKIPISGVGRAARGVQWFLE